MSNNNNNNNNKSNAQGNGQTRRNSSDERYIKAPYEKRSVYEDSVEYSTMPKYSRPGKPGNK